MLVSGSLWLVKPERKKLALGCVFFTVTVLHGSFFMLVDFGLFWLMRMLRTHGELVTQEEGNL